MGKERATCLDGAQARLLPASWRRAPDLAVLVVGAQVAAVAGGRRGAAPAAFRSGGEREVVGGEWGSRERDWLGFRSREPCDVRALDRMDGSDRVQSVRSVGGGFKPSH